MTIIRQALEVSPAQFNPVRLAVERLTLSKRRWRGVAEDGTEFGFDLERPLPDGSVFHQTEKSVYLIAQKYEAVLELRIADCGLQNGTDAARVGWLIGNLHFQIEVLDDVIRVVDDPAVRQMFERESIKFTPCKRVFHPVGGGHSHGHSH
jgi:urease accessory protein